MFEYENIKINYVDLGKKDGEAIVYLHGWGQNIEMMMPIAKPFLDTNRIIIIDLPGFGESEEPKRAWTLQDYVKMIHELLDKLKIKEPNIIGHSFGGKLAILYGSQYKTKRLVLLASPYKIKIQKVTTKMKVLKSLKKVPGLNKIADAMKKHMGSTDYKNATPMMREILVKHVNTDATEDAKKITCPTLIVWGTNDQAVPVADAYDLEKIIKNSGTVIYDGCTHYAYLERLNQTISVLKSFIK